MSRIEQALKRRQKEGKREEIARPVWVPRRYDVETPIVPAWQLERFPVEAPVMPDLPAPPAVEPVTRPDGEAAGRPAFAQFSRSLSGKLVIDAATDRKAIEQFRHLAGSLHHVQMERGTRKLLVTSAVSGEGKTLTALNLALTLSASYRRKVVLVDANLRNPRIHSLLNLASAAGLSEALDDRHQIGPVLLEVSPRLSILPGGSPDPDPVGPLTSVRMGTILDEMAATFDWVIIDAPPVLSLPDTNLLAGKADAAIVVIEAGRTPHDLVERAVHTLGRARVLGFVLNRVHSTHEH